MSSGLPPLLWEAIERQPPDIGGSYTWVCGCVEYTGSISLCSYHGGYEDALTVIAGKLESAVELLDSPLYGLPQRALRARTMLEQIRKDCGVTDEQHP
jgi:hypothetical protein